MKFFSVALVATIASVAIAAPVPEPTVAPEGFWNPGGAPAWKREAEPAVSAQGYWNPGGAPAWKREAAPTVTAQGYWNPGGAPAWKREAEPGLLESRWCSRMEKRG
nr:uncharacterized protein I203_05652 [Kwoniella mangroviensis CBS 8507]OCF65402.1 hypothetical protein I203_05652 [Kwoniella mangroviensis CBS 8507]